MINKCSIAMVCQIKFMTLTPRGRGIIPKNFFLGLLSIQKFWPLSNFHNLQLFGHKLRRKSFMDLGLSLWDEHHDQ